MDMLKNLEIEESSDQKAASGITQAQKLADLLEDYFDTDDMFQSIEEMDNKEKKKDKDDIGMKGEKAPHGWNKACKVCANKKSKKKCEQCWETCYLCQGTIKEERKTFRFKNSSKMKSPKKKKGSKEEGASKKDSKSGTGQNGKEDDAQLYYNNKQALMALMEKKGKEELIRKGIELGNQTSGRTLQEIANIEDMTVEQLLYANNISKDDREKLPAEKLQRPGRKKSDYKDVGSDDNSNGKKESDNENEIEGKVDEEAVATVPALQYIITDKNKEEAAKNKAIEPEEAAKNKAIKLEEAAKNEAIEPKDTFVEVKDAFVEIHFSSGRKKNCNIDQPALYIEDMYSDKNEALTVDSVCKVAA
eukprot:jgi/Psemu1/9876/gm1.9876_g